MDSETKRVCEYTTKEMKVLPINLLMLVSS